MLMLCTTALSLEHISPEFRAWHESQGVDHILVQTHTPHRDQAQDMTRLQREALVLGADWVINSDIDEFWVAREGTLADLFRGIPANVGVGLAEESEFSPDGEHSYEGHQNWMGFGLRPKCAHRPSLQARVGWGNASVGGVHGMTTLLHDLEVLHWPIRTQDQAKRKCETLAVTFPGDPRPALRVEFYREMAAHPDRMMAEVAKLPSVPDARLRRVLGVAV